MCINSTDYSSGTEEVLCYLNNEENVFQPKIARAGGRGDLPKLRYTKPVTVVLG